VVGVRLVGEGPQVVFLTRAAGESELENGIKTIRDAVMRRLGSLPPSERTTHGDHAIESYPQLSFTKLGDVLAVSNSRPALEKVIDLARGTSKDSVMTSPLFQPASISEKGLAQGGLAMFRVRPRSIPGFHIPEKADNPLGSLLLGGWLGALEASELVTGALQAREGTLELEVSSILGAGGLPQKYRGFFPTAAADPLARRLEKRGVLGVLRIDRDLSRWWAEREELLVPSAAGNLLEFSQFMNNVLARNFQDEVLPELGAGITLVARNQEYRGLSDPPRPAIPGFAGVFELKSAPELGTRLAAAFQTLVGLINLDQAMKKKEGGMVMLLKTDKVGEVDFHTVSLNLPKEAKLGIAYNFTPSLAVVGSRVVISSSQELAKLLVEELVGAGKEAPGAPSPARDTFFIDSDAVGSILGQNLELLVSANMLKKGIGKAEADGEMNALLDVLKQLRDLRLWFGKESGKEGEVVKLKVTLRTQVGSPPAGKPPAGTRKKKVSL